jgi:hypothetical protein
MGRALGGLAACFWGRHLLRCLGHGLLRGVIAAVVIGAVSSTDWLAGWLLGPFRLGLGNGWAT